MSIKIMQTTVSWQVRNLWLVYLPVAGVARTLKKYILISVITLYKMFLIIMSPHIFFPLCLDCIVSISPDPKCSPTGNLSTLHLVSLE